MAEWGERIRDRLQELGMSNAALARAVGIASPSVHAWVSGNSSTITGENLLNAARTLGVSPYWIMFGEAPRAGDLATSQSGRPDRARLLSALTIVEEVLAELRMTFDAKRRADLVMGCYIALEAGHQAEIAKSLVGSLLEAQKLST